MYRWPEWIPATNDVATNRSYDITTIKFLKLACVLQLLSNAIITKLTNDKMLLYRKKQKKKNIFQTGCISFACLMVSRKCTFVKTPAARSSTHWTCEKYICTIRYNIYIYVMYQDWLYMLRNESQQQCYRYSCSLLTCAKVDGGGVSIIFSDCYVISGQSRNVSSPGERQIWVWSRKYCCGYCQNSQTLLACPTGRTFYLIQKVLWGRLNNQIFEWFNSADGLRRPTRSSDCCSPLFFQWFASGLMKQIKDDCSPV